MPGISPDSGWLLLSEHPLKELFGQRCCWAPHLFCRLEHAIDGTGMHTQSCVGIVMSHLEILKVFHPIGHTNFKDWQPSFMAEKTPLFKHLLVVLLGSFCSGVNDIPGNFFSDTIMGTDGNVSLQEANCMLLMTFEIAFLVVAFHGSHWDGLNLLSGSIC